MCDHFRIGFIDAGMKGVRYVRRMIRVISCSLLVYRIAVTYMKGDICLVCDR